MSEDFEKKEPEHYPDVEQEALQKIDYWNLLTKAPKNDAVYLTESREDTEFFYSRELTAAPFIQDDGNLLSSENAFQLSFRTVIIAIPNKPESIDRAEQAKAIITENARSRDIVKFAIPKNPGETVKDWYNQTLQGSSKTLEVIKQTDLIKPPMTAAGVLKKIETEGADDPNELIKNRVICKGGIGILAAETGCGKSSFIMQAANYWALGRTAFGMEPKQSFQTLIIQAENDWRDIQEEIAGVNYEMQTTSHLGKPLIEQANLKVSIQESTLSGDAFVNHLDEQIAETRPALVIIDPLLSFAGCDATMTGDITVFLRNKVLPVVKKHNIALLFVHHKVKPPRQAATNQNYNGSYDLFGSSDISNCARYIINLERFIMPGSEKYLFRLSVPKRGTRLKWPSRYKFFEWGDDGIYWKEVTDQATIDTFNKTFDNNAQARKQAEEEKKKRDRDEANTRHKVAILDMTRKSKADPPGKTEFISRIMAKLDISNHIATGLIEELKAAGQLLIEKQRGKNKLVIKIPNGQ